MHAGKIIVEGTLKPGDTVHYNPPNSNNCLTGTVAATAFSYEGGEQHVNLCLSHKGRQGIQPYASIPVKHIVDVEQDLTQNGACVEWKRLPPRPEHPSVCPFRSNTWPLDKREESRPLQPLHLSA
ncbi:hypothetical protein DACRYDRAFT_25173, partial [Dacryopinax primogenitus]